MAEYTKQDEQEVKNLAGNILRNVSTEHHPAITWFGCLLAAKITEIGSAPNSRIEQVKQVQDFIQSMRDKKFSVEGIPDNPLPVAIADMGDALKALREMLENAQAKGVKVKAGMVKDGKLTELGETDVNSLTEALAGFGGKKDAN